MHSPTGLVLNYVWREATRLDDPVGSMMHPIGADVARRHGCVHLASPHLLLGTHFDLLPGHFVDHCVQNN